MKKVSIFLIFILLFLTSCNKPIPPVSTIYVDAESYIVLETNSKRILEGRNIHKRILPASTTKVLTCLTVINYFDIDQYITITYDMINIEGSRLYLQVGEIISIRDLLYGLMLQSGNDASLALALGLCNNVDNFTYLMNEECKRIGMTNSTFENPNGLDEKTKNYTTAYDMALLMSDALNNPTFRKIASTREYKAKLLTGRTLYYNNKHKLIHTIDTVTGGKTGYTKQAGRTLLTSFKKDNMEIVVGTFNAHNDWETHSQLANKSFNNFMNKEVINVFKINNQTNYEYKITLNDLLFPIENNETINDINTKLSIHGDILIIKHYKDNKLIGYKEVKKKNND